MRQPELPQITPARPSSPSTRNFAVPVLMYHRICNLTEREARSPLIRDLTVSPADFDEQIRYLVENGFAILSVKEVESALREGRPLPEKAVALTMDDGYRDNFTCAFPILRKYNVPATVFLVTAVVGDERHLSWDDARVMQARACGFQSHTVHHYDLTTLPTDQLDSELRGSKQMIEEKLNSPVTQIAYPSGSYNRQVTEQARQAGYNIGWKKGGGPVTPGDDPFMLPRIRVHGRTEMKDFERKVWSGVYIIEEKRAGLSSHSNLN
ncbi:MAG: polysaccharide deacetylase family protein [Armatimonadota bacterium]